MESWEKENFSWPAKDAPTQLMEVLTPEEEEADDSEEETGGSEREVEAQVTMSGRATGKLVFCCLNWSKIWPKFYFYPIFEHLIW